ncbi:MAG: hypothetical protein ACK4TJ_00780 [Tabrizicola sp.]
MPAPERIWLSDGGDYDAQRRQQLLGDEDLILWSDHRQDDDDTAYVRADLHERALSLLREATAELRAEAQALVLCASLLKRDGDRWTPKPETMPRSDRQEIEPLLDLIRRIEALAGRPADSVVWMDRLLDSRTGE